MALRSSSSTRDLYSKQRFLIIIKIATSPHLANKHQTTQEQEERNEHKINKLAIFSEMTKCIEPECN
jgi:hypothetical protein